MHSQRDRRGGSNVLLHVYVSRLPNTTTLYPYRRKQGNLVVNILMVLSCYSFLFLFVHTLLLSHTHTPTRKRTLAYLSFAL